MTARTIRRFMRQEIEAYGEPDLEGNPAYLASGFVVGTESGSLLLSSAPGGQVDQAIELATVCLVRVKPSGPKLTAIRGGGKVVTLSPSPPEGPSAA